MSRDEQRITKPNPFTTALVIGLGWGLVFGFVDGLPILLNLPFLQHLRMRLQALVYLMVWSGLLGSFAFGLLGLVVWAMLRLLKRESARWTLVAGYSGLFVGLATSVAGLRGLNVSFRLDLSHVAILLTVMFLGGITGVIVGLGIRAIIDWWQSGQGFLRPLRWKTVRAGVLMVFLVGVMGLFAVGVYRSYLRDLAILRSKPSGQGATPERPNIVLITIDALRADHLGVYGYDPEISPNIDALAKRGVVFDQTIAQAPWTAPSVASFLTSLYPTELGVYGRRGNAQPNVQLDEMRVTLAEILQTVGYRTSAYVGNLFVSPANQYDQGFDHLTYARRQLTFDLGGLHERTLFWALCRGPARKHTGSVCRLFNWGHGRLFDHRLGWYEDRWVSEYGMRFLQSHRDERFFLWLFYIGPHSPYDPPDLVRPLPSEITPRQEKFLRSPDLWRLVNDEEIMRPEDIQALTSLYDSEIAHTDALVGRVLDELERLGLADVTVVVLLADHGEELGDHGHYGHVRTLYDELVRVPLVISGPGVEVPGRRVETQVSLIDVVPTVCDLADVPSPEESEGRSLVPFLTGEEMEELPAFSEGVAKTVFERKSIRHNGYKLIYDVERETVELYNLEVDPGEQVNLAEQEPEMVEKMLADLQAWMDRCIKVANELPRVSPLGQAFDDEMEERLRDAGY